jgi:hypothetical protein
MKEQWIEYSKQKPDIGKSVIVYRDLIDDGQIYHTIWSEEEENWAGMNYITHWMYIEKPQQLIN